MNNYELTPEIMAPLAATVFPSAPLLAVVPMRGGLEGSVARLTIRDASRQRHVIVKRLTNGMQREASRYRLLAPLQLAPPLLGTADHAGDTYLFLDRIRPATWPWRDSANTTLVLQELARIHHFGTSCELPNDWDYERELRGSAAETLEVAANAARGLPEVDWKGGLRALRRVVAALDEVRGRMMESCGTTLIHGDVHTGNVMLRAGTTRRGIVFLDWARSRAGSPLEDVSSWLLSLRTWEAAAARDHDTLFRDYLAAAGRPAELTPALREAYWYAAASNALAGALRYQVVVAEGAAGKKRATAIAQVHASLRVIRRAGERLGRAPRP